MDLYINREALARGLQNVQGVVERRSTHPVLAHVLLHAAEGQLRLTATDTQVAYIGELEANVATPGDITVEAASFHQVVRLLPEPTVQLAIGKGNRLEITCGRAFFRLPGGQASEFPALPAFDEDGRSKLVEGELARVITQCSFAVSTDDNRYGLNGAHVQTVEHGEERRIRWVGTDGHRLAASEAVYEGEVAFTERMLISRKALGVMKRLLDAGSDSTVDISFGAGSMRLRKTGTTFWFRLIEGEFPEYERVLPAADAAHSIRIRREELAAAMKRVSVLVQERVRAVEFAFGESELTIQVHSVDRGEITETLPIELEGDEITAGFNARYLGDVLDVLDGEYVQLSLGHALAPCIVRDPDRDDSFFVVMPMRLD